MRRACLSLLLAGLAVVIVDGQISIRLRATNMRGPQASITCTADINGTTVLGVSAGASTIHDAVTANDPGDTLCLAAGTYLITGAIRPKDNMTFLCEFGAVIDGTNWSTADATQAAFRAHNQDIDAVTIKNCTIGNMPQRGIHAQPWDDSTGWILENNEITNAKTCVVLGDDSIIRRNRIHACGRGQMGQGAIAAGGSYPNVITNVLVEDNEIWDFGSEHKFLDAENIVWRGNHIHHADGPCIWNDGFGDGFLAEGNTLEDCDKGIMFELSRFGTIRNNTIRNSVNQAIYVSTSRNLTVSGNRMAGNLYGVHYFVDCDAVDIFGWLPDLKDNVSTYNDITVPARAYGGILTYHGSTCTGAEPGPYINNMKNNNYNNNTYRVLDLNGSYWLFGGGAIDWTAWQALSRDTNGTRVLQ